MSEKRIALKHGDLIDKKVLYQIYKSEDGKGMEMYMFYESESTMPIDVDKEQIEDEEWMYYRAMSFIQNVERVNGVG
jgi:hypothetical protein